MNKTDASEYLEYVSNCVGLREVRESNIQEWRWRIAFFLLVYRSDITALKRAKMPLPSFITAKDIKQCLGMKFKVSRKTRQAYCDYMLGVIREVIMFHLIREDEDYESAK